MKQNRRKRKFLNTPFQKKILKLVFYSASIPTVIITVCMYYLILNLIAEQLGIPEAIAYNVLPVAKKVLLIISTAFPLSMLIVWRIALVISNKTAGPLYRIEKELEDRLSGKKQGDITIRENDELQSLVEKINKISKTS